MNKLPPFKGPHSRIPIQIPVLGRGFLNHGSTLWRVQGLLTSRPSTRTITFRKESELKPGKLLYTLRPYRAIHAVV